MRLYKFTSMEFIPSCIENGVFASNLNDINDPYEGKGIEYPDLFRVVCMTDKDLKMLMWAYYGNHRGCCVEFEVPEEYGIRKVTYDAPFQSHEDMNVDEIIESLYKKGPEWKPEEEYRLVYYRRRANPSMWRVDGNKVYLNANVKSVLFGLLADVKKEEYLRQLLYLQQYNSIHDEKISVSKCRLQNNRYRLSRIQQFDLDEEIRRIIG